MTDNNPLGDLMGKPIHAYGGPTPDRHPGYNPVVTEQPVKIDGIFQVVNVDATVPKIGPWLGVVERITYHEETDRVTIELTGAQEFSERTKAFDKFATYVRRRP